MGTEDPSQRIRGLWFHDDNERMRIEGILNKVLEELRRQPAPEPQLEPQFHAQPAPVAPSQVQRAMPAPQQLTQNNGIGSAQERVPVSMATARLVAHTLADDDFFLKAIMGKLQAAQA